MFEWGGETEHSAMKFNLQIPPDVTVWDFMFDFDKLRWVHGFGCGGEMEHSAMGFNVQILPDGTVWDFVCLDKSPLASQTSLCM